MRRCWSRILNALRPGPAEDELAREASAHLTLLEDDYQRRGMSAGEARVAARRAFGGVEQMKDRQRDARSFVWLDDARRDLGHAVRLLRRAPLFTLTAVLSLAIGIGANATIFSVANAVLFRTPAGVADPDRLVDIGTRTPGGGFGNSSYPNYLDLRQWTTTLDSVYAYSLFPRAMSLGFSGGAGSERIFGTLVTGNYFAVLGVVPAAGTLFRLDESDEQAAAVVLSHRFWTRRFNQDPSVVGRAVSLNGRPFTIVGVAADGFQGTGIREGDVWVPLRTFTSTSSLTERASHWLLAGGRLKPGVPLAAAAAEADTIARGLAAEYRDDNKDLAFRLDALSPVPGGLAPLAVFFTLLLAIVGLVLVIACANLTGVLLARAAARRQEIAVRLAMGAGRSRLVRQLLAETLMLFALGGVAGLTLSRSLMSVLVSLLPALPFPVNVSLAFDARVLLFTAGVVFIAAMLSGLVPALQASKADVVSALKDDAQIPARLRLRHVFVIAQVAFSILLVVVAGLFVRALRAAGSSDPGFDPHGVELASLNLSLAGYTDTTGPGFVRDLVDRVRALPEVQQASVAVALPGGFETQRRAVSVPGVTPAGGQRFFGVDWNNVEPGYFATLRIPLAEGRDFTDADRTGAPLVAIVGEGTARQFWPGRSAVGQHLVLQAIGPGGRANPNGAKPLLVVGVVRDIKASTLVDGLSRSLVYVPLQQQYLPSVTIAARTTRGQRIADQLRWVVTSADPNLPIVTSQTLAEATSIGLVPQRVVASAAGSLGFVGALLAAIGIYGVAAYGVARRTREIGIRMALGAQRSAVVVMVLRQGIWLAVIGSAIGLLLAAGASRVLVGFLFGIPSLDPIIFGGAAALFALVAFAACYVPARRATRIDPLTALRCE
jgi:putative ABC transport system permease protein